MAVNSEVAGTVRGNQGDEQVPTQSTKRVSDP